MQGNSINRQNRSTEGFSKIERSVDMTRSGTNGLNIRTNAREKGRDLTQPYDKSPYTHRKIPKASWTA